MNDVFKKGLAAAVAGLVMVAGTLPVQSHHSFAMFDGSLIKVFTGVVVRINPDANHLQIFFAPLDDERKAVLRNDAGEPIIWAVEMGGSAAAAQDGVSVNGFPPGTIFSVGLHPLRNGQPAGDRGGSGLFRCPEKTPPASALHCDSVEGATSHGEGVMPEEGALTEEYNPDA
jgi:hypothetical protein